MNEKVMVADTLAGINGELTRYGEMIPQTENPQLKQTLKQMRNQCEMSQEEFTRLPVQEAIMCRQLRQQGKKWIMSEACLARDKRG